MTGVTTSRFGRRTLAPLLAAGLVSAAIAAPIATAQDVIGTCAVTKWNFDQAGVEVSEYPNSEALLAAVLEAKNYEEGLLVPELSIDTGLTV